MSRAPDAPVSSCPIIPAGGSGKFVTVRVEGPTSAGDELAFWSCVVDLAACGGGIRAPPGPELGVTKVATPAAVAPCRQRVRLTLTHFIGPQG